MRRAIAINGKLHLSQYEVATKRFLELNLAPCWAVLGLGRGPACRRLCTMCRNQFRVSSGH
jgi:hypothetical protein